MMTSTTTNYYQSSLDAATSADIMVLINNGTATFSSQIISGSFGSTGYSSSGHIDSTIPITGLVIGFRNPHPSDGNSQIANNLIVGPNYWSTFVDTTGIPFQGGLGMFTGPIQSFNTSFTLTTQVGYVGQIYMFALTEVPEPNMATFIGLGLLMLIARATARRKSV